MIMCYCELFECALFIIEFLLWQKIIEDYSTFNGLHSIECPCLVFAYIEDEKIGSAVPYDIQETENKSVKLVLDESNFEMKKEKQLRLKLWINK